jgi:hypothetical protein
MSAKQLHKIDRAGSSLPSTGIVRGPDRLAPRANRGTTTSHRRRLQTLGSV